MMKKKLLLGIATLALASSSVQAGYLRIDSEDDFERVHRNVSLFWNHYRDVLPSIAEGNFDNKVMSAIKSNPTDITREALMDPHKVFEDIKYTVSFLDRYKEKLDPKGWNSTRNGLILMGNMISELYKR